MALRTMCGRKVILTDVQTIDETNVVSVLRKALVTHLSNKMDIEYLWKYYKGRQPILDRVKDVRPEIMNRVVVNRANEIVSFKVGYLMGEPVQYVSRDDDQTVSENISKLNSYMLSEDKPTKDKELAEWQHIAGTAYRFVLPDSEAGVDPDEAPFEIYTLDPRFSFVVRYNDLGRPVVMGVKYVERENGVRVFGCYTDDHYYEIDSSWAILKSEEQIFGIPIIEYPLNNARLGAFEVVLPLLDAIAAKVNAKLTVAENGPEEVPVKIYHTLPDVPDSYRPTIQKLMEKKALCGYSDPDPTRLDDNIIDVDEVYCRVMTTLDRLGVLG